MNNISNKKFTKVLFRLDSGGLFGLGHFMRSKALADALYTSTCTFAVKHIHSKTAATPHNLIFIQSENELITLVQEFDIVIIDHYDYTTELFYQLSELIQLKNKKLVVLDDECNRGNLYADLIVNPVSTGANGQQLSLAYKKVAPNAKLLLGSKYILLRDTFNKNEISNFANRDSIVITFGGSDVTELTLPVLKQLSLSSLIKMNIIVVTGSACPNTEEIKQACNKFKFEYQHNVKNMATLFTRARFAISAAGSTVFELATMGVPGVFAVVADNQLLSAHEQSNYDWCSIVDCREKNKVAELVQTAEKIMMTKDLINLSKLAQSTIDGKGAERVAKEINRNLK